MDDPLDDQIRDLVASAGITANADQVRQIVANAIGMGQDVTDRLDLKITNAAVAEMRNAFRTFAPFQDTPKVTIFGSARTRTDDPQYVQTHDLAAALAAKGWMVVTGAGPGIMQAAMEGAGAERSIGVSIRLPFEERANTLIHDDPKHVSMKYFFTRKLMLVKESRAFVSVPGGFGTLDETFELLTLIQTGKEPPAPVVLFEPDGDGYWKLWREFVNDELLAAGLVSPVDLDLVRITSSVDDAMDYIDAFYRTFDSMRYVDGRLVVRLCHEISDETLARLNAEFADIVTEGRIERTAALPAEVEDDDDVDRPRLILSFDQYHFGRLHQFIRAL